MTIRNLAPLFNPTSVALIGASGTPGTLGAVVLDNVLSGGFPGAVYAVNPRHMDYRGADWVPSVDRLPGAPDLAIVMTPAETVPGVIAELGAIGTKCAVVISAGITDANGLRHKMLDAARPHLLRVVGPNCLGISAPHAKLNATFARTAARPGRLGLISQSGALVTAILDWADNRQIGFSGVASVGDMADVDLGDLIDLFAVDPRTDAIMLYVEGLTDAAKFLSAARAAAVSKPVIAIKAGRTAAGAAAALSHTGALAGSYDVYRAAFARAGIVTVDTLTELFDAAEVLCHRRHVRGERLSIVTNGGGAGILAVDAMGLNDAKLASLSPRTQAALDRSLPRGWSGANPIDIRGDAGPEQYRLAIRAALRDDGTDALLVMNCPTGTAEPVAVTAAVRREIDAARADRIDKPVLACWLGDTNSEVAREQFRGLGMPVYRSPDDAVRGFGYLLAARRAREALTDAPADIRGIGASRQAAQRIIDRVRADQRTLLTEVEAKELLSAYGVPTVPTRFAPSVEAVEEACGWLHPPFVVKLVSPDIIHKSEVGGVALELPDHKAAAAAACRMEQLVLKSRPTARITGYAVEEMIARPHGHEVFAGIATDPTFGPVVMFGAGGTSVEVVADRAIALPPLDHAQAGALIGQTRIAKLLAGYRNVPPADLSALAGVLCALSQLTIDLPDVRELDINPILVSAAGVIALDARIVIAPEPQASARLAIRPAPMGWTAQLRTQSGVEILVRPVRADDEPLLAEFFTHVSPEDLRFRFMSGLTTVGHDRLAMMTHVDYRRTISFLAFDKSSGTLLATAMLAADPDRTRAEVAMTTRSDMKGKGISWSLFEHVLRYAEAERIGTIEAIECADHDAALRMEREMGFAAEADPDDPTLRIVRRKLAGAAGA